jgi:hypothetical protein
MSVDEFIATPADVTTGTSDGTPLRVTRKRKATNHDELKKRARLHCKCPEQWKSVSRYNPKRLEEFVQERDFMNTQQLYDSIFGFTHRLLALVMDTAVKGDGHVQREIENDLSLRQAIEQEGSMFVSYLTNRFKIAALTAIDTFNGKQLEIKSRPIYVEADCETDTMAGQDTRDQTTNSGEDQTEVRLSGDHQ